MTESEMVEVLNRFTDKGFALSFSTYVISALVTLVFAAVGAFMSSYLKKSGEVLAVTNRLQETILQLEKQTRAVEEIRSDITNRAWIEQQKWEFRKDLYIDLIKGILKIRAECLRAEKILGEVRRISEEDEDRWDEAMHNIVSRAEDIYDNEVHTLTEEFRLLVNERGRLFLDKAVLNVLGDFFNAEELRRNAAWEQLKRDVKEGVASPDDHSSYDSYEHSLYHKSAAAEKAYAALVAAAKSDLKIKA